VDVRSEDDGARERDHSAGGLVAGDEFAVDLPQRPHEEVDVADVALRALDGDRSPTPGPLEDDVDPADERKQRGLEWERNGKAHDPQREEASDSLLGHHRQRGKGRADRDAQPQDLPQVVASAFVGDLGDKRPPEDHVHAIEAVRTARTDTAWAARTSVGPKYLAAGG